MRLMWTCRQAIAAIALAAAIAPCELAQTRADELVDIRLDSKPRRFDPQNPLQAEKQEFSLSKPGIVTLIHVIDPVHKDSEGGFTLEEVHLSNYVIGKGIFQERVPDPAIPGQMATFKQKWLCGPRKEPLSLRATVVAPHRNQAFQIRNAGEQLGASQRLIIAFVPMDKISSEEGPRPAIDVSGKWLHGDGAVWTLTPKGNGEYEAVEKGADNAKGTAHVKGRKIYIDWVTTTAKDGVQKHGVSVVEVKPDGHVAEGWSVGDGGTGGEQWFSLPGTLAKPIGPPDEPSKDTKPDTTRSMPPSPEKPAAPGGGPAVKEPADAAQMTIQAGTRTVKTGDTVSVPLWLIRGQGLGNLNLILTYDAAVARTTGALAKGNLLDQSMFEANPGERGVVRIGFAQNKDLAGPVTGTLAQITFTATGQPGTSTPLRVEVTAAGSASGGKPSVAVIHGEIRVVGADGVEIGDSDRDGNLTARDVQNALKMSVRLLPVDMVCDMDKDGQVTSTDARLILQKVVGK